MDDNTITVVGQPLTRSTEDLPRDVDLTIPGVIASLCCILTGIPATIYAIKAQRHYKAGRWREGEEYQRLARGWITFTAAIGLINIAAFFILRQFYIS